MPIVPMQLTFQSAWLNDCYWPVPVHCHLYADKEAPSGVGVIIPRHARPCSAPNLIILKAPSLRQVPHTVLLSPGEFVGLRPLCAEDT